MRLKPHLAAARLDGVAHRTPVLTSRTLDALVGAEAFIKCENFQRVGAFKFRGACNAASRLTPGQLAKGVAAYSSGNHAQAVALAALIAGRVADPPRRLGVIASGGNIDTRRFTELVGG